MITVTTAYRTFRYSQRHDALARVAYLTRVGVSFTTTGM